MLTEKEFDLKVGQLLTRWRKEAGIKQEAIAKDLKVDRRTIYSLEHGERAAKYYTIYLWALLTGHDPDAALAEVQGIHMTEDTVKIKSAVINRVRNFRHDEADGVLFVMLGNHGSDLRAFIHLCAAYLHCSMRDRQSIALQIINNYKNTMERGEDVCPEGFHPDLKLLEHAQEQGRKAFIRNENKYFIRK